MVFLVSALWLAARSGASNSHHMQVLFIGNALTYTADIPAMLEQIAASKNTPIELHKDYYHYLFPHARWQDHAYTWLTRFQLRQRQWDAVILQEQSTFPALDMIGVEQESFQYARLLTEQIRQQSPRATIIILENWASQNGDKWSCRWLPNNCTYEGMQNAVTENMHRLVEEIGARLAPVGEVWQLVRAESPIRVLYQIDEQTPSALGAYVSASTLYRTLFQKPVAGASYLGIKTQDAAYIQQVVDEMPLQDNEK